MMKRLVPLTVALLMSATPMLAQAKNDKHEKQDRQERHENEREQDREHGVIYETGDHDIDEERYDKIHGKQKSLPPGLQKKVERGEPLPPGWQKKYDKGDVLDDDVYRHGRVIDADGDYETVEVEDKVYRVMKDTREILDILR